MNAVWEIDRASKQQQTESTPQTWKRWSSKFSWVDRAHAFDRHKERLEQEAYDTRLRELLNRRMMREMRVQGDLESLADRLLPKIEKLVEMPPTTVEQVKYDDEGKVTSKSKIRGVPPSQVARLIDSYIELQVRTVHGLMRISRSIRIQEEDEQSSSLPPPGQIINAKLVTDDDE